ncbi:hypothetical protein [Streptococcus suis]|uniref:hypothetical protein n=1 Tax=Streptococcus suis TaxID=1307 RepID=UPI001CE32D2C|nr:hypothetical protein [Streptococcus suis]MCL4916214.1 hypothetical protein [Streptococcus suis]MCQ9227088.1 hypothetical protein [Streptococcus suis]MCQ9229365.1 hypothetical protein [Streptococcus suis]MCQ9243390.1 hypothetical protein [Streptococcus suis]MCQ9275652.1 hypothetical protein [Streptococcus suis]
MMEAQDNFKSKPTNIAYLNNATAKTKPSLPRFNDIIESSKQQEDSIMPQETYTKSEIDLKFDKISTDVQHSSEKSDLKFDALAKQVDLKFDNFENKLENLFANLKVDLANEKIESLEQARKDKRELILWSIGTAVAILGILIPLILNK